MTTETAIATTEDRDHRRQLALLKAVGLDRVAPEQRELALAIAKRYDLDLMLKHLVLIDGRPYLTRDGLLHIAHRSGVLDGIETTEPTIVDDFWRSTCSVYRKDMGRPFKYTGRYPIKSAERGYNAKFAPEMAVKVGEVMALRRAFDVSAPAADERWDADVPVVESEPAKSLAEKVAQRAGVIVPPPIIAEADRIFEELSAEVTQPTREDEPEKADDADAPRQAEAGEELSASPASPPAMVQCESISPYGDGEQCRNAEGHPGRHRTSRASWE